MNSLHSRDLIPFQGTQVTASLDGKEVLNIPVKQMTSNNGFVAIGTETFAAAYFDNFKVKSAKVAAIVSPPSYIYQSSPGRRQIPRQSSRPYNQNVVHMQQFRETVQGEMEIQTSYAQNL